MTNRSEANISPGFILANTELAAVCNRLYKNEQAQPLEILDALLNCAAASLIHIDRLDAESLIEGFAQKIELFAREYQKETNP